MGSLIGPIIISLIVFVVIFIICRELICWYYKINTIVELMEDQNKLLGRILANSTNTLQSENIDSTKFEDNPISNSDTKDFSSLSDLTKKEIDLVNQLYSGLKANEVIVKHVANGTIQKMSMKDYNDWIKYYDKESLILLVTK